MKDSCMDERKLWRPPARPDWVQRINDEGRFMNIRGVVPLDSNSLIESAKLATGLSDFGNEEWREPFEVLVQSLENDADLNLMGRIRTRSEILQLLEARLQIENTYKKYPEIEKQEVVEPFIIIGQGRSGTSLLCNLLASNPDNHALLHWEAMLPCPPPEAATYMTDPRIEKAHHLIDQWNRVTPTFKAMHEFGGSIPMEDNLLMALTFMSPSWMDTFGQIRSYDAYIAKQDMEPALLYHKRVLKLLQWKNPRQHWVLKDVTHIDHLPAVFSVYPDACVLWPHRDPARALASAVSIVGTMQWGRSDHPFKGGSFELFTDPNLSAARFNAAIDQLENGTVPGNRIFNLLYKDLVDDPLAVIKKVYEYFDMALSSSDVDAMDKFLDANPRDKRPAHQYALPDDISTLRRAYERYQNYFQISDE